MMRYQSSGYSHMGCGRYTNQDAFCSLDQVAFWAVSDGMGGGSRGEVASSLMIKTLEKAALTSPVFSAPMVVEQSVEEIHQYLKHDLTRISVNETIGTTLVSLFIQDSRATCHWIGDSRLYLQRGGQIRALTRDHSRAQDLVRRGLLTPGAAKLHPARNCLTQAIGMAETVHPEKMNFSVESGDRLLLCSDGLYQMVSLEEIFHTLKTARIQDAARELVAQARDKWGSDDMTAVVVEVGS